MKLMDNSEKKSAPFIASGDDWIHYEFFDDKIGISFWDECPKSTLQWIKPSPGRFRLVGTSNEDVRLIAEGIRCEAV